MMTDDDTPAVPDDEAVNGADDVMLIKVRRDSGHSLFFDELPETLTGLQGHARVHEIDLRNKFHLGKAKMPRLQIKIRRIDKIPGMRLGLYVARAG